MEFLGKLGIDIKLLIAQIINFGILLWLLKKFLYAPIVQRIEEGESELGQAKVQQERLEEEKERIQRGKMEARQKARDIIVEAELIAKRIRERAQKETEEEKQKVIQQIHARLESIENEKIK